MGKIRKKSSPELSDLAPDHSKATVELVAKLSEIAAEATPSSVIIVGDAFNPNTLAAVNFSKDLHTNLETGRPSLDMESIEILTTTEKMNLISGIIGSVMAICATLDQLMHGFFDYTEDLRELKRNLKKQ